MTMFITSLLFLRAISCAATAAVATWSQRMPQFTRQTTLNPQGTQHTQTQNARVVWRQCPRWNWCKGSQSWFRWNDGGVRSCCDNIYALFSVFSEKGFHSFLFCLFFLLFLLSAKTMSRIVLASFSVIRLQIKDKISQRTMKMENERNER